MAKPATHRTAGGKSNHMLTNKTARKNIKPRLERAIKKTERREAKKNIQTDSDMFDEREALQRRGFVLCENRDDGGDENCNAVATHLHRKLDCDVGEIIPVCPEHSCSGCITIENQLEMRQRLKCLKQPLDSKTLYTLLTDCERNPKGTGSMDVAVYGFALEIVNYRELLKEILMCELFRDIRPGDAVGQELIKRTKEMASR